MLPRRLTPIKRRIKTEKIRNNNPATAATIMSRPAASRCWSPEDIKTLIEPMTIKIKAMPPARPVAIDKILPAKVVGLVEILPKAVGQVPSAQGLVPGGPVPPPPDGLPTDPPPSLTVK